MKPMGRKAYKDKTGGKRKDKFFGKTYAWWLSVCKPNKKSERQSAKREIEKELV